MTENAPVLEALQAFAESVTAKMSQLTAGEPEDQLRGPFENFMDHAAKALGWDVVCTGETPLPDRLGRPDFAVHVNDLLAGFVELKAPGTGANVQRFTGRNREQWKRFANIPNILYTDGNEWALYQSGELVGKIVRLSGNVAADGRKAVAPPDDYRIDCLLRQFLSWAPFVLDGRKGKFDLERFAAMLAPLCRMLRNDVADTLKDPSSPLVRLARDWRQLLFPGATDEEFADAYAQTVTFALLLGRSEKADPLTLENAEKALSAKHSLLARALLVLTDWKVRTEIAAPLDLLLRLIGVVPEKTLTSPENPWLHFYEHFLAAYDPRLRKDVGAYYTPLEIVRAQVRLVEDLLVNRLGRPLGYADPGVVTLDPATGTGTYLLGVIEHSLHRVEAEQGTGAVAGQATALADNLHGFELMVGPFAVAELRVSRALHDRGATMPPDGAHVYLTDTLESPNAEPLVLPFYMEAIAEQHAKALRVKSQVPVIVCLGNPPYDRHVAAGEDNRARTGGWVRWGDTIASEERGGAGRSSILRDFIDPAVAAGHGVDVKNLYNLYVYFWRWALWKVFERETVEGPGVVSFISASSYLDGGAFCGMREHIRRQCDEVWILDLGGEGRGTRKSENVFAIQTPVAIAVAMRPGMVVKDKPAKVHYARIEGTRAQKLKTLDGIKKFRGVKWQDCPGDWQAPFRPAGKGQYFNWPLLTDLMPWQHSGCEIKRTWPICHDPDTLQARWRALLVAKDQALAFKETRDRKIGSECEPLAEGDGKGKPIAQLPANAPVPRLERYAFRSFDRQWMLADSRVGDYFRPSLWRSHGPKQVYLASSVVLELGVGPAVTSSARIPDRHYFAGRGGKDVLPLYRDADGAEPNIGYCVIRTVGETLKKTIKPEDLLAYIYGTLAQPAFTARYAKELENRELRVPITKDAALFEKVRAIGAHLLWLHTYGERYVPKGKQHGHVPRGAAKCTKAVPGDADGYPESFDYSDATRTLRVGTGEFSPVSRDVFEFEVSGLKVMQSWLKYRMKKGSGKKSSPLDDIRPERWSGQFTTELLELLWVLEATVTGYPEQARLLEAVIAGECFLADELPPVPEEMRKPPVAPSRGGDLFDGLEDN
jgi:hypothetical protein